MNMQCRFAAAGLLLAAFLFPAGAALAQNIPGAAARVNGVEITNLRLEIHLDDYLKSKNRNLTAMINPRVYKKLKREALDQLIEREVLWQAAQAAGITISDEEAAAAVEQAAAQFKTPEAFRRKLEKSGFDDRGYADYVRREISGAKYLLQVSQAEPEVSEADVRTAYEQNKQSFTQPETLRARHILLKTEAAAATGVRTAVRAKIEGLLAELRGGADFAELARRHSEDRSAADGGDLGEFSRGRMVKPFEDAVLALQPGEISGVVETRFGYHLIKLEARTPAKIPTLEETRDRIRQRLIAERRTEIARRHTADLIAKAKVDVMIRLDSPD